MLMKCSRRTGYPLTPLGLPDTSSPSGEAKGGRAPPHQRSN